MNKNPRKKKVTKETDPKVLFRRSKAWSNFRLKLRKKQKYDYVTGSPLAKNANCHHLCEDPKQYEDISDEERFVMLNSTSHTVIHYLWGDGKRRYDWKERLQKLKELCEMMDAANPELKD